MAPSPEAPVLELQGVGKRFSDGTLALEGIDLEVRPGELVAVVGPSGCGKSTLLRIVAGLAGPTSGLVAVRTRRIGFVFQDPTLVPWRSVRANVELLGELEGMSEAERQCLADEAIAVVGLGEFAGHPPQALSGGMRMRASLARSLMLRPDLFLLDEPFGALDELTRHRLNDELSELFMERRFAALLVTHSVTEALFLSSRVVVMSGRPGRVIGTFQVPFPYPRASALRFSGAFSRLAGEVSQCLRAGAGRQARLDPARARRGAPDPARAGAEASGPARLDATVERG
jgi:NitT/TauT family transport system ATP-binding protein